MNMVLLSLVVAGTIEVPGAKSLTLVETREIHCDQQAAAVVLVADGSSGWQGEAAIKIVDELNATLDSKRALREARFDAEPTPQLGFTVKGARRDLVMVRPRTPMREAMETGFTWLITVPRPRTMVVIAHEQFYPTKVSTGRLIELARRSGTKVHTIHLASSRGEAGVFRHLGRSLKNGIVWFAEVLVLDERGYSARDTERLLKLMADSTGGKECVAADERSGIACADAIAGELVGRAP